MTDERDTEATPEPGAEKPSAAGYERSDRAAQKRSRTIRLVVLGAVLLLITAIGVFHQYGDSKIVGVDALCPFGGIETLWAMIAGGALIQRIAASSVILLAATVLIAVFFRRSFCGYICPLGALQEFFGKIGKAIWPKKRPVMPAVIDKPARWLKYVVLGVFTLWTWQAASLVIRPYDPWVAYMHLSSAEVFAEFSIGLAILVISIVGSIVYERFFCKYLCPMGAFLGAISRFSVFKVRRVEETCIDCGLCDKACPSNIKVSVVETVESAECINCNECVNVCPVKDTLVVGTKGSAEKARTTLTTQQVLLAVVGIFVAVVLATSVSGAFAWTLPTLAPAVPTEGGAPASTFDVETIKGSMTVDEIAAATAIPAAAFEAKFGITPAEMGEKIKDLAAVHSFDVHTDFRDFVKLELEKRSSVPGTSSAAPASGESD